jgi:hypothetical protein
VFESPSPYEIPTEVKSAYDATKGLLLIEFRYVEREPEAVDEKRLNQYFVVRLGKTSRRIWSFVFDVHQYNRDHQHQVREIMDAVESKDAHSSNGAIAAQAFCTKGEELLAVAR